MRLLPYSFDGHSINDTTNYTSFIPDGASVLGGTLERVTAERWAHYPIDSGVQLKAQTMTLIILMRGAWTNNHVRRDEIKSWFDVTARVEKKLIFRDSANSAKEWYIYAAPIQIISEANKLTITLSVAEPIYRTVTINSDTWAITATGQTNDITTVGQYFAKPIINITPLTAKGGGYTFKRFVTVYNQTSSGATNYPIDLVNGSWDTAALVTGSKMLATGNDCRVIVDGNEVPRWFGGGGINSTTTKVWININLAPKKQFALNTTVAKALVNNGAGINNAVTTIPYDNEGGTMPTGGTMQIDNEQITYTGKSGGNFTGCTRGVNNTSAAAHADNAVIYQKISSLAVVLPKKGRDLKNAIAALDAMPKTGSLAIGTEILAYTGITSKTGTFSGIVQAAKGTTGENHAVNDAIIWIEHDIYVVYGDADAVSPDIDATKSPIFALTSTNTSWVYTSFCSLAKSYSAEWSLSLNALKNTTQDYRSNTYTATENTYADPATDAGMSILSWIRGAKWQVENADLSLSILHPFGITTVTSAGKKRYTIDWYATSAALRKSPDGKRWVLQWAQATPSSTSSWEAWTKNSEALGATYNWIKFHLSGSYRAYINNKVDFEISGATLTLDSNKTPTVAFGAESATYYLDCTITNTTTGDYITVETPMIIGQTVRVDTDAKAVTYLYDGTNLQGAFGMSTVRAEWLPMIGGAENTFRYDEAGVDTVTIVTTWQDRNS